MLTCTEIMKKIALVTGAAKRIGKEIALHLASKGWHIAIHYNSSEKEAILLHNKIPNSILVKADLNSLESIDSFFLEVQQKIGDPTLLINNAAIFERESNEIKMTKLQSHMNINCFAPILLAQKFAHSNQSKKNIINIVDSFIHTPTENFFSYRLSKLGLFYATKFLAKQFDNCRVNSISPGMVIAPENREGQEIFKNTITAHPHKQTSIKAILNAIDTILGTESMNGQDITEPFKP